MKCPDPPPCKECGTKENLTFDSNNDVICVKCYNASLSNVHKIRRAEGMGWLATLEIDGEQYGQVVVMVRGITDVVARDVLRCNTFGFEVINKHSKITGYLYGGQLAGNDPIPEGQLFKVKRTGNIVKSTGEQDPEWSTRVSVYAEDGYASTYSRFEIEPYFN